MSHRPNLLKIKSFPLERIEPSDAPPSPEPPPIALWVKSENFCMREPGASVSTPGSLLVIGLALVPAPVAPALLVITVVAVTFPPPVEYEPEGSIMVGLNSGRPPRAFLWRSCCCWFWGPWAPPPRPSPAGGPVLLPPPPLPPLRATPSKLFLWKSS